MMAVIGRAAFGQGGSMTDRASPWFTSIAILGVLLAVLVAALAPAPTSSGAPAPAYTASASIGQGSPIDTSPALADRAVGVSPASVTWLPQFVFSDERPTLELNLTGSVTTLVFIGTGGGCSWQTQRCPTSSTSSTHRSGRI